MGILYVVATPVGNLEDITFRAVRVLLSVPVVACEDTRRTGTLIKLLKEKYNYQYVDKRYISIRDWNEARVVDQVIGELGSLDVALVSDAGTPLISDPGYKLVRAVRSFGIKVVPIPGASAVTTALSAAGLPTDKFVFLGFNWKKHLIPGMTNVIYENCSRVKTTTEEILKQYPGADIVVAWELTKIHENIGKLTEGRGEATILAYIKDQVAAHH